MARLRRARREPGTLGDPGYESERAHVLCREELGVESIIPTTVRGKKRHDGRPRAIRSRWRKRLKRWFPRKRYGQCWRIETLFSMVKRNLGSAFKARKPNSLNREVIPKVIVHNLMVLKRRWPCSQRSTSHWQLRPSRKAIDRMPFKSKHDNIDKVPGEDRPSDAAACYEDK